MIELEAPIAEVTVYPDRARVTRRGTVTLEAGEHRLRVDNLPLTLQTDSVRAGGQGTARARLLGIDVSTTHYTEPAPRNVAELQTEIEAKEDEAKALADEGANLSAQMDLLSGLSSASSGEQLAKGISFGRAKVADGEAMLAFVAGRMADLSRRQRELNVQRRKLGREIARLKKELEALNVRQPTERYAVTAEVEMLEAGDFTLEVRYVVGNARWRPLYDVRVSESGEPTVALTYLGEVHHTSGEDWENVALTLSTAKPALSTVLPELRPWYLDVFVPEPPRKRRAPMPLPTAAAPVPEMMVGAEPMDEDRDVEAPPVERVAEAVEAQIEDAGAALAFRVLKPVTVPGDGSPRKTTVAIIDLKPKLDYVTAPRLVQQAYRRARVTNDSEYTFLPGRANVFYEDEFVGNTILGAKKPGRPLQTIAPGQEFKLFLGADDRVKVERELVAREVDKKLIGNTRRLRFAYRIGVQNLRDRAERVVVTDQIPVARREEIKVKLDMVEPKPSERTELGLLRWELDLGPGQEQNIRFDFAIEHPRDLTITGLPGE